MRLPSSLVGLLFLWVACACAASPSASASPVVWRGWGTSLCWFAATFGDRADLAKVLYTTGDVPIEGTTLPGLNFNIARYNNGAESNNQVNGSSMVLSPNMIKSREIEGFWVTPDTWQWNRDIKQVQFLKTIVALNSSSLILELFSNSPMWWQLLNHNPSGAEDANDDNLDPNFYQDHALYMAQTAKYFHDTYGITFDTVEPFNEPASSWWHATNNQEGCHFDATTQMKIIPLLRKSLDQLGLQHMGIASSDETYFSQAIETWNTFDDPTRSLVAHVNVHGYQTNDNPNDDRATLYSLVSPTHTLRMNEHGDGDGGGATLAQAVIDDINILHVDSWVYWQALDGGGWGLIAADESTQNLTGINTKYYVLAQYSRHIQVGDIIDTSPDADHTVVAYRAHKLAVQASLVIFVTYAPSSDMNVTYSISPYTSSPSPSLSIHSWLTTTTGDTLYKDQGISNINGTNVNVYIPQNGVMTTEISIA